MNASDVNDEFLGEIYDNFSYFVLQFIYRSRIH